MKKGFSQSSEATELLWPFLPWILLSTVTGIGAGAATVALLDTINHVLHHPEGLTVNLLLIFTTLCILVLIGRVVSDISTNRVGQRLVAQVRKVLARKILEAPIDVLERYRTHRLIPVLTQDIDMISDVAFTLASTVIAIAHRAGLSGLPCVVVPPVIYGTDCGTDRGCHSAGMGAGPGCCWFLESKGFRGNSS